MQKQILITLLAFTLTGHAYAESDLIKASIYCESAGSLADSLEIKGFTDLSAISNLNIRGIINAEDFRYIKTMYALDSLDISQTEIEAFYGYGTYEPGLLGHNKARNYPANAIPMNAFNHRSDYNNSLTGLEHLSYVKLPATLTEIQSEAFAYCNNLSEIGLNDGLEKIGANAFTSTALTSVTLPASVTSMGGEQGDVILWSPVFDNCTSLERIEVDKDNTTFKSIDGVLYSADGYYLRQYPTGKKDTEYIIPEGTAWICHMAFSGNQYLQTVSISSSVKRLERAFWNCPALTTVICTGENPPVWYAYGATTLVEPFDSKVMTEGWLFIPKGTKDIYQQDTFLGWGLFKNIKEEENAVANLQIQTKTIHITTSGNQLCISRTKEEPLNICIYTFSGKLIYNTESTSPAFSHPIEPGHYIVCINHISYKIYCP